MRNSLVNCRLRFSIPPPSVMASVALEILSWPMGLENDDFYALAHITVTVCIFGLVEKRDETSSLFQKFPNKRAQAIEDR